MRTNGTELAVRSEPSRSEIAAAESYSYAEMKEIALDISKSGMFSADRQPLSPAQVLTLMLISRSRGLPMIEGVMRYDVIEGKPAMKARCLLAEYQAAGGKVKWLETTDDVCRAVFWHPTQHPEEFPVHLTLEEFHRKGVTSARDGIKRNWKLWSKQMLMARASSLAVNAILPGISMGVPVAEEMDSDEPGIAASPARTQLVETLKAKLAPVQPAPVAQPIPPAPRQAVPEAIRFIIANVEKYNEAASQISDETKYRISVEQVVNHMIKLKAPKEDVKTDGKRDKSKVADVIDRLWQQNEVGIRDECKLYLEAKLDEIPQPEPVAADGGIDPSEVGDMEGVE